MLSARRRARVSAALTAWSAFLVVTAALVLVPGAAPARADSVRNAEMWVLDAINVRPAWQVTEGRGVVVAVIDSGVNGQVSDLTGSVISGPDYTGVHTPPSNPNWGLHGTWMASLIAGHGHGPGDASGIIGVAPQARVLSIRVITDKQDPGYAAYERQSAHRGQLELARAIRYAVGHRAEVISMSLGYNGPSLAVRAALQDAYDHRVVVVASSGNSGTEAEAKGQGSAPYSFPADYPGVLGVAAVGENRQPAAFSSDNISVQVAAPGVNVPAQGRDGGYWLVSGTSPACALTAGVAALIKSRYPRLTDAQVGYAITRSTWRRPAHGPDDQVGFGTVDAAAALTAARRLARQTETQHAQTRGGTRAVVASSHFGGGPAAVPAPPIRPRGALALALYCLLGAACLVLIGIAAVRLVALRPADLDGYEPRRPLPPTPGWGLLPREDEDAAGQARWAAGADGAYATGEVAGADPSTESDAVYRADEAVGPDWAAGAGWTGWAGGGAEETESAEPGGEPERGKGPAGRFPWQPHPGGRHAAPPGRSGWPGGRQ
jgi:hypothetical protein